MLFNDGLKRLSFSYSDLMMDYEKVKKEFVVRK